MIPISLVVSWDWVSCCRGIWIVSGGCKGLAEGVGDWESGEGFLKEAGQLGLRMHQFGESEHFGGLSDRSLCGGGSLQSLEVLVWFSWDLQEV
jgi:hypothetical protein